MRHCRSLLLFLFVGIFLTYAAAQAQVRGTSVVTRGSVGPTVDNTFSGSDNSAFVRNEGTSAIAMDPERAQSVIDEDLRSELGVRHFGMNLGDVGNFDECLNFGMKPCVQICMKGFPPVPMPSVGIKFSYKEPIGVYEVQPRPCDSALSDTVNVLSRVGNHGRCSGEKGVSNPVVKLGQDGKTMRPTSFLDVKGYGITKPGRYAMNGTPMQVTQSYTCYIVGWAMRVYQIVTFVSSIYHMGLSADGFSFSTLKENVMAKINSGLEQLKNLPETLAKIPQDFVQNIQGQLEGLQSSIEGAFESAGTFLSDPIGEIGGQITELTGQFEASLAAIEGVPGQIEAGLTEVASGNWFTRQWDSFATGISQAWDAGAIMDSTAGMTDMTSINGAIGASTGGFFSGVSSFAQALSPLATVYGIGEAAVTGDWAYLAESVGLGPVVPVVQTGVAIASGQNPALAVGGALIGVVLNTPSSAEAVSQAAKLDATSTVAQTAAHTAGSLAVALGDPRALAAVQLASANGGAANYAIPEGLAYAAKLREIAVIYRRFASMPGYDERHEALEAIGVALFDQGKAADPNFQNLGDMIRIKKAGDTIAPDGFLDTGSTIIAAKNSVYLFENLQENIRELGSLAVVKVNNSIIKDSPYQQCRTRDELNASLAKVRSLDEFVHDPHYLPGVFPEGTYRPLGEIQKQRVGRPGYGCPMHTAGHVMVATLRGPQPSYVNCYETCKDSDKNAKESNYTCPDELEDYKTKHGLSSVWLPNEKTYLPPGKNCMTNRLSNITVNPATGLVTQSGGGLMPACNGWRGKWKTIVHEGSKEREETYEYVLEGYEYIPQQDQRLQLEQRFRDKAREFTRLSLANVQNALNGMDRYLKDKGIDCANVDLFTNPQQRQSLWESMRPATIQQTAAQETGYGRQSRALQVAQTVADLERVRQQVAQATLPSTAGNASFADYEALGGRFNREISGAGGWSALTPEETTKYHKDYRYLVVDMSHASGKEFLDSAGNSVLTCDGLKSGAFNAKLGADAVQEGISGCNNALAQGELQDVLSFAYGEINAALNTISLAMRSGGLQQLATGFAAQYDPFGGLFKVFDSRNVEWGKQPPNLARGLAGLMFPMAPELMGAICNGNAYMSNLLGIPLHSGLGGVAQDVLQCAGTWGLFAEHGYVYNKTPQVGAALVFARTSRMIKLAGLGPTDISEKGPRFNYDVPIKEASQVTAEHNAFKPSGRGHRGSGCYEVGTPDPTWYGSPVNLFDLGALIPTNPSGPGLDNPMTTDGIHVFTEWKHTSCCLVVVPCFKFKQYY